MHPLPAFEFGQPQFEQLAVEMKKPGPDLTGADKELNTRLSKIRLVGWACR
ncbi:hypothetical protein [Frankia sp. Cr2]|uniref:hypothetical protein n=1 Tax=Frankia sp. Cr2 TaxID=3073932 RepID=UPI002AD3703A|nr:hypothetical protein [Frankia sp. Cr2]